MAVNQLGSALFILALYRLDLSFAQPLCNALAFVFTAVASAYLGETRASLRLLVGGFLITVGTWLCLTAQ
jgi:multidrug transporter EmrE-like cation transporter